MTNTKALMRSACMGAILAATGMSGASAQQTIAPASATPVPGPMPEILRAYAPVTAERLKKLAHVAANAGQLGLQSAQ